MHSLLVCSTMFRNSRAITSIRDVESCQNFSKYFLFISNVGFINIDEISIKINRIRWHAFTVNYSELEILSKFERSTHMLAFCHISISSPLVYAFLFDNQILNVAFVAWRHFHEG